MFSRPQLKQTIGASFGGDCVAPPREFRKQVCSILAGDMARVIASWNAGAPSIFGAPTHSPIERLESGLKGVRAHLNMGPIGTLNWLFVPDSGFQPGASPEGGASGPYAESFPQSLIGGHPGGCCEGPKINCTHVKSLQDPLACDPIVSEAARDQSLGQFPLGSPLRICRIPILWLRQILTGAKGPARTISLIRSCSRP